MKKILCTMLIVTILMSLMCVSAFAEKPISIVVGGEKLATDVAPVIINGRTLVPLRAIFEALDATVEWNNDTRTVTAAKDDTVISLTIGEDVMKVNGADVKLDVQAQIVDGRTMIPVRAVSEALDCEVSWNNDSRTVRIKTDVWMVSSAEHYTVYNDDSVWYQWEEYTYNEDGSVLIDVSGGKSPVDKGIGERWMEKTIYDGDANIIKEVTIDPATNEETVLFEYVYENGLMVQDNSKKYIYDDNGRLVKVALINKDVYLEVYTYDETGNMVHVEKKRPQSFGEITWEDVSTTAYTYDDRGNVIREEYTFLDGTPMGEETITTTVTEYTYDADNNLICKKGANYKYEYGYEDGKLDYCRYTTGSTDEVTEYDYWGDTPVEYFISDDMEYVYILHKYLNPTDYSYELDDISYDLDEEGRLVEIEYGSGSTRITYDENGNVSLIEGSGGGYTKYEYVKVKW